MFPQLYLPVMEEANRRVLAPWRSWLPTPATFQFASRMKCLNSFILQLLRKRWAARVAGQRLEQPDVLERILASVEVHYRTPELFRPSATAAMFTGQC